MSHIVSIQTEIRDPVALKSACLRLELTEPVFGEFQIFSDQAIGWAVELPEWRYPVVCNTDTATLAYDNYDGHWGDPCHLDRLRQSYAIEKTKLEARRQGHTVIEQPLNDGSIQLTVNVGGGA